MIPRPVAQPDDLDRFSAEMRQRVTGLYGVEPWIEFVEIAQIVDNAGG